MNSYISFFFWLTATSTVGWRLHFRDDVTICFFEILVELFSSRSRPLLSLCSTLTKHQL